MRKIDIVFAPAKEPGDGDTFVEVEDDQGRSIKIGEWIDREDGTVALRIDDPRQLDGPEEPPLEKIKAHVRTARRAAALAEATRGDSSMPKSWDIYRRIAHAKINPDVGMKVRMEGMDALVEGDEPTDDEGRTILGEIASRLGVRADEIRLLRVDMLGEEAEIAHVGSTDEPITRAQSRQIPQVEEEGRCRPVEQPGPNGLCRTHPLCELNKQGWSAP